jgi:hypothetical protein
MFKEVERSIINRMEQLGYKANEFYVVIDDPRYPSVVFWENYQGFWWDSEKNKLGAQFCTCGAYGADECACGAWDDE